MGYDLHIEGGDEESELPISLEDWLAAVAKTQGLQAGADSITRNPQTDERILIPAKPGDVDVWFAKTKEWVPAFSWHKGSITFRGSPALDDANQPVRNAAASLAKLLSARIVGDEGEEYEW